MWKVIVDARKGVVKRAKQDGQVDICMYIVGHSTKDVDEAKEKKKGEAPSRYRDQQRRQRKPEKARRTVFWTWMEMGRMQVGGYPDEEGWLGGHKHQDTVL